jgi:hypothetical protein
MGRKLEPGVQVLATERLRDWGVTVPVGTHGVITACRSRVFTTEYEVTFEGRVLGDKRVAHVPERSLRDHAPFIPVQFAARGSGFGGRSSGKSWDGTYFTAGRGSGQWDGTYFTAGRAGGGGGGADLGVADSLGVGVSVLVLAIGVAAAVLILIGGYTWRVVSGYGDEPIFGTLAGAEATAGGAMVASLIAVVIVRPALRPRSAANQGSGRWLGLKPQVSGLQSGENPDLA